MKHFSHECNIKFNMHDLKLRLWTYFLWTIEMWTHNFTVVDNIVYHCELCIILKFKVYLCVLLISYSLFLLCVCMPNSTNMKFICKRFRGNLTIHKYHCINCWLLSPIKICMIHNNYKNERCFHVHFVMLPTKDQNKFLQFTKPPLTH